MQRGKIFRKDSSWHLRYKTYTFVNGTKKWQTTSVKIGEVDKDHRTQASVENEAKKILQQINEIKPSGGRDTAPTFREQALIWLSQCENRQRKPVKPSTLKNWRSYLNVHILPMLQNVPLPEVNNLIVKNFVAGLKVQPKTIGNIMQVVKAVKASAIDEQGEGLYPTKWNHTFIDMPRVISRDQHRPSFSAEQIDKIVEAGDRQMQMLAIMFAATGLRAGEMFGLEIKHFDGHAVHVEQEARHGIIQAPKTDNAHRTVDLHPDVARLLKSFIGVRKQGFVFANIRGKPIRQSNFLRRELHPILKGQGIPQSGFHSFRRYRNTYLRNVAGCPDGLLKYWLGHSAARDMSDRYDKVRDDSAFRLEQAERMGVGIKIPKQLKPLQKKDRIVVQRVVRNFQPRSQSLQKPA